VIIFRLSSYTPSRGLMRTRSTRTGTRVMATEGPPLAVALTRFVTTCFSTGCHSWHTRLEPFSAGPIARTFQMGLSAMAALRFLMVD